jgi:hypothetical protein
MHTLRAAPSGLVAGFMAALVLGGSAGLVGCVSGGGATKPSGGASSPGASSGAVVSTGEVPYVAWVTPSPLVMPLNVYYDAADAAWEAIGGLGGGSSAARDAQIEDYTAECMLKRGFTYYPESLTSNYAQEAEASLRDSLPIPYLPQTLDETKRVGYGVSRPEHMGVAESPGSEEGLRNTEYRDSLSVAAQREYDLALVGYYDEVSYGDSETVAASCRGQADVLYPPEVGASDEDLDYWSSVVEPLYPPSEAVATADYPQEDLPDGAGPYALERNPEMIELNDQYSQCVKANAVGWDASFVSDTYGPVSAAMIVASDGTAWAGEHGRPYDLQEIPYESRGLVGSQIEIDIAVVDFQCRSEVDYVNTYARIQADSEAQYLADHQAAFDQMLAALENLIAAKS